MIFLTNSFSLNMISDVASNVTLKVNEVSLETVKTVLAQQSWTSAVGHQSTCEVLTHLLDMSVPCNRVAIKLQYNDILLVFQLLVRLEEGKVLSSSELKTLPYKFYLIELV